jgi:tetratricopeptide (TPR) repeat protein
MDDSTAQFWFQHGVVAYQGGDYQAALSYLQQSLSAAREADDANTVYASLGLIAEVHKLRGEFAAAETRCLEALEVGERVGFHPSRLAPAVGSLGDILLGRGDLFNARRRYEQGLEMIDEAVEHPSYGQMLYRLGEISFKEGDYAQAVTFAKRIVQMWEVLGNPRGKADALSKLGISERTMGDVDSAIPHLEEAYDLAISCGDHPTAVISLCEEGFAYAQKNDHASAVSFFERALSLRQQSNFFEREEIDRAGLAHSLMNAGRCAEALEQLDLNVDAKGFRWPTAGELMDRATCYTTLGRANEAIPILQSLLDEARRESDLMFEANCLGSLGLAHESLGDLTGAHDYFRQALPIHQQLGDGEAEYVDLINLERVSKRLAETGAESFEERQDIFSHIYEEAARATPDAEKNFEQLAQEAKSEGNILMQAFALNSLGLIARDQGALEKAVHLFREGIEMVAGVKPWMRVVLLGNLGIVYRMLEDFNRARQYYEQAIEEARNEFGPDNPLDLMPRINLVKLHLHVGDVGRAEEVYNGRPALDYKGLDHLMDLDIRIGLLSAKGDHPDELVALLKEMAEASLKAGLASRAAFCYEHLGYIHFSDLSDFEGAREYYDHAIDLLQRLDFQSHRARLLRRRAGIWFEQGRLEEAYQDMTQAIRMLEQQRASLVSGAFQQRQRVYALDWYALMIRVCTDLGKIGQAVEYVERARAQNLVSLLSKCNLSLAPHIPTQLAERFRQALAEQQRLDLLMLQEQEKLTPSLDLDLLRDQLQYQAAELDAAAREVAALDPAFTQVLRVEPIRFEEILELIPRDKPTAVIEFFMTAVGTTAFLIIDGVPPSHFDIPTTADTHGRLHEQIRDRWLPSYAKFLEAASRLSRDSLGGESRGDFNTARRLWFETMEEILSGVYEDLFAGKSHKGKSIADTLREHGIRRIIIMPHGLLHMLPLHAASYVEGGRRRYLIDDYEISYAPSCQVLQHCLRSNPKQRERFVAFADPDGSLPFARREVDGICDLFPAARVFSHGRATLAAVEAELPGADIAHFSCHGTFNPASPLDSHLVMADGRLSLAALFERGKTKPGSLVTLAACESGLVRFDLTDEYVGLPSGFLFAGASCVLSSLWSVSDSSSFFLMRRTYQNFRESKMSLLDSLQEAQCWLREATVETLVNLLPDEDAGEVDPLVLSPDSTPPFAHPFYWAAFQAIGNSWIYAD